MFVIVICSNNNDTNNYRMRIAPKYIFCNVVLIQHLIKRNVSLVGKHILQATDLTSAQIKTILWTAFELKRLSNKNCLFVANLNKSKVILLMHKPSVLLQTAAERAANLIKVNLSTVIDSQWDSQQFMQDAGKFFSAHTDVVLCQTNHQITLNRTTKNSSTPFICLQSYIHETVRVLSDMMTIQEHFGYLKRLNLACVGSPCGRINTYLCIAPKLDLNIQFYCCCGKTENKMSPAKLQEVKRFCNSTQIQLKECNTFNETFTKAHIIATSSHNSRDFKVIKNDLKNADPDYVIIHGFPRGDNEVDKELFESQRNLVWQSSKNLEYVIAATIVRVLKCYKHITQKPDFEKLNVIR